MDKGGKFYGIDFGTTNTTMVCYDSNDDIKISIGERMEVPLPSVVALNTKTGIVKVGFNVKNNIETLKNEDYEIVLSIKTILDDENKKWVVAGSEWTTIDVAAEIFKSLIKTSELEGVNPRDNNIVISVPVNFSASKKKCLEKAAIKAGLKIERYISEPTAAFFAHYEELKNYTRIVVFDWGGGTLDISALKVKDGNVMEICTDNLYKAGDIIDEELARKIYSKIVKSSALNFNDYSSLSSKEHDSLKSKAEILKISFSNKNTESRTEIFTIHGRTEPVECTYQDLCEVSNEVVNEAIEKLANVISKAFGETVDCILCVGGSSNLRLLRERLYKLYGDDKVYFPNKPEWDIADGACTIAASPSKNVCLLADDVELGLSNGDYFKLLSKGQTVPCEDSSVFVSTIDCSEQANFIFRIGSNEYQEVIPVLGGIDEVLKITAYVDKYSNLHINMENQKTKECYSIFTYEKLDFSYTL